MHKLPTVMILLAMLLTGCNFPGRSVTYPITEVPPTLTPTPTRTEAPTATATPQPTETPTQPSVTVEAAGCLKPVDDYTRVQINGESLNQRTLSMLVHAKEIYAGELEINGYAITQGSYANDVSASFGTHAGGGAVDLSVLRRGTWIVLWDDVGPLIDALRRAGFAAWLRDYGELYTDSPIHIHAIAIGDRELSAAAEGQLTGAAGYFRGYSGLTDADGAPTPDRYGGPILCAWMLELGYSDLR